MTDPTTRRLQRRLKVADSHLPPQLVGMKFVRHVKEGRGADSDFTWSIYISHDPCHDSYKVRKNRNTVIALHRTKGIFKILGRELPLKVAMNLACGLG